MLLGQRLRVPTLRALRQARVGACASPRGGSLRLTSTSAAPLGGRSASLALLVGVGAGGVLVGYLLAPHTESASAQTPAAVARCAASPTPAPRFGSPEDFRTAIAELRAAFDDREDAVTTDENVLRTHGFSEGDYLPGALLFFREYGMRS
jgi:D-lactate dehydrogenase (cytochrome)